MDNWDQNEEGKLTIAPLLGWESANSSTMALVRLAFARTPDDFAAKNIEHLQIGIRPDQARLIAEELIFMADQLQADANATRN